jgi:DNA-binding SARP family transcriptional activator
LTRRRPARSFETMLTFRLLGGIALSDDTGADADDLLRKPKSAALLAYLALPHPGTWHRRDSVVGIFWPDNDQSRGRSALRSALLVLRRGLPDGAIASRGDDELSLDPTIVTTDVAALGEAVAAGRFAEALDLYQGELMPGLFVPEAPEFERWLDQERDRIRVLARKAAAQRSLQCESEGKLEGAIDAARHAAELNPNDEATVR